MNLFIGRRHILRGIETDLVGSDPWLAMQFAMFTEVTRDEEMPGTEKLKAGPIGRLARLRSVAGPNRLPEYWRSWFWTSVLLAILVALPYSVTIGGTGGCVAQACAIERTFSGSGDSGNGLNPATSQNSTGHTARSATGVLTRSGNPNMGCRPESGSVALSAATVGGVSRAGCGAGG